MDMRAMFEQFSYLENPNAPQEWANFDALESCK